MTPETFFEDSLFESGIGHVVVCRYKSGGRVEAGVFLVDVFCLGVKNAFFQVFSAEDFQDFLSDAFPDGNPAPRPGADGRKLVEGAVAYARSLGFAPHPDFKKGAKVFGGIDPADSGEAFAFGKNGKPFYINGPHETAERSALIVDHLEDLLGQGGFDFHISAGENPFEDAEDDDSSITAIDSEAEEEPSAELVAFAGEFLESHPDFSSVNYPGPALSTLARDMLENARIIRAQMQAEDEEEVPLEFVLRTVQLAVNILAVPPGEREKLLRMAKDIDTEMLRNLLDKFDLTDSPDHMVMDLALLNSDQPGRERLLLLLDVF